MRKGVDCSGLVCEVYKENGINIPDMTAAEMFKRFQPVAKEQMQPGDLIFYYTKGKSKGVTHVGIYSGNGMVYHASSSKGTVNVPMSSLKYPVAGYRRVKR